MFDLMTKHEVVWHTCSLIMQTSLNFCTACVHSLQCRQLLRMLFLPSVPSPPLSLMAVDIGSSSVSLAWISPSEPNGILLFYRVAARQEGSNTPDIVVELSANMSISDIVEFPAVNKSGMSMANTSQDLSTTNVPIAFTLTKLSSHTNYVITVEANTSAGYGNRSEELNIQTSMQCICVCVCACVRACVHACVRACVCVCVPE